MSRSRCCFACRVDTLFFLCPCQGQIYSINTKQKISSLKYDKRIIINSIRISVSRRQLARQGVKGEGILQKARYLTTCIVKSTVQ